MGRDDYDVVENEGWEPLGRPPSTMLDVASDVAITALRYNIRKKQGVAPGMGPNVGYPTDKGNIGNCQGQITVTYYVKDSPVVET